MTRSGCSARISLWIARDSGTTKFISGVAYGAGRFVAVGGSGSVITSPDGIDWSPADPGTPQFLQAIAFANGMFVAAGGAGTVFPFQIPLGDAPLALTLYEVRIEGTVELDGDRITSTDAVLAGAVKRSELRMALNAVPEESLPFPPETIASLLDLAVVDDIDTDGNGEPDAASIGIKVEGIGANLVGVDR